MRTKIVILKWVDKLIGRLIVILLSKVGAACFSLYKTTQSESSGYRMQSFLIIRPGGIGDAALLFPALDELRKSFPHSQIHVLAEKRNGGVLELCPHIDRLYLYDRGFDLFRVLRNRYDAVIDTEQWHRLSAVIACLTGAKIRAGFSTNERGKLFTHKIEYSHADYEAYSFLKLFGVVLNKNIEFAPEKPFITNFRDKDSTFSIQHSTLTTIALFIEASIKEREWGIDKFSELADKLVQRGISVIVIGKKHLPFPLLQKEGMVDGIINLTGKLSLAEVVIQLSKVNLLVTGDSGIMHIAYGLGIPTVSLFGPGIEEKWAPKGKNHIIINKRLPCSPCTKFGYTPACPMDVKCMRLITTDEVEEAVLKLLSKKQLYYLYM